MEISVIIPTYGRPEKIAECVRRLVTQSLTIERYEVLVGVDGGRDDADAAREIEQALHERWPARFAAHLTIEAFPKIGLAAVRNGLLEKARGRILVSLNDDVLPSPGLLAAHLARHDPAGPTSLVVGRSPWVVREPDRLFDRLIRETSMVFFYQRMDAMLERGDVGPKHDWGFRHCWGLNFSVPRSVLDEVGGFSVYPIKYGYEDLEFAHRVCRRFDAPVLYAPEALAHHDHRMEPDAYLRRERALGAAAWGFAGQSPACALDIFGRDITSPEEVAYAEAFVAREAPSAERVRATFLEMASLPSDAVPSHDHPSAPPVIEAIYQQHLLLKRWEWRTGLVESAMASSRSALV